MSQLLGLKQEQDKQKFLPSWKEREKNICQMVGKWGKIILWNITVSSGVIMAGLTEEAA